MTEIDTIRRIVIILMNIITEDMSMIQTSLSN